MWKELFDRVTAESGDDWGEARVPPPSARALDEYERQAGFRLPASYRGFVSLFGPCRVGYADVASPGYPAYGIGVDLRLMNEEFRSIYGGVREENYRGLDHGDLARMRRLVVFGSFDADWWGWDPEEVTDSETHEYAVWSIYRMQEKRVADTFAGFVESQLRLHLGDKVRREEVDDLANSAPPIYPVARKKPRRRRPGGRHGPGR